MFLTRLKSTVFTYMCCELELRAAVQDPQRFVFSPSWGKVLCAMYSTAHGHSQCRRAKLCGTLGALHAHCVHSFLPENSHSRLCREKSESAFVTALHSLPFLNIFRNVKATCQVLLHAAAAMLL